MAKKARDTLESLEIDLLLTAIERRYGYDFRNYARMLLRCRIRRVVRKEGLANISELQSRVLHDPSCMQRFLTHMAGCATPMFRDAVFYSTVRRKVVPLLRTYPFIRIWHVGCATGEEVYSMAILLEEEGIYDRCRIYATDLSADLLDRARAGTYPLAKVRNYTSSYHHAGGRRDLSAYYMADGDVAIFQGGLRRNVVFALHNLASDASFNEFNIILCRNVLIYFDKTLRDRVHRLLYGSLGMFGVLGLGMKDVLLDTPHEDGYQPLDESIRLYRRIQ